MTSEKTYDKPEPLMFGRTKEFYEFCKKGELRFQRCTSCRSWRHVPRMICNACGSWEWEWAKSSGRGKVFTWTVVNRPLHPAFMNDAPYAPVVIELEEGIRLVSWLKNREPDKIEHDMAVEVVFEAVSDELTLPLFRCI
jgi:uncharacterized OB-fold protein